MTVKLACAVAAQIDAPIMIFDEVFAFADFVFQEKCFSYFEECKRRGKTIILVTHSPGSIKRFADRAMLIHHSRNDMIGEPNKDLERYLHLKHLKRLKYQKLISMAFLLIED